MNDDDDDLPPVICKCGHKVRWYFEDPNPDKTSIFYEINEKLGKRHIRLGEDVVERACPHKNGTVIQYCPTCDRKVSMWGMGPAGGMECECWDE